MTDPDPRVDVRVDDGRVVFVLNGEWTLAAGPVDFERTFARATSVASGITFDTARLGDWDTTFISFLFEGSRFAQAGSIDYDIESLPRPVQRLLKLATAVPEKETGGAPLAKSRMVVVGEKALGLTGSFSDQITFVGEVAISLGRLLAGKSAMRVRDFWVVVEEHGPRALPIVGLICFMVGLIIAFLGSVVLTQFGAGIYNAHLVGFGMLRELGALMTGIIMVGRSGAAFAAEIGSMKVSEEIDAYTTLGISPIDFIVLPRMLALFLMMPLLTVFGDVVGILGGMFVSASVMDIGPQLFLGNLFGAIGVGDFAIGIFKGTVFGALIAVSGCMRGMQSGNSADAVGKATTSAVVTGITLIISANALIDWLASIL
jgi:phospholipid/cholesterol/gamma-HCH transport system permease protein